MGEVYRARDSKLDREVAVKVLPSHLTSDADALARFEREAKAVAALSHPNILAIHDFGTQDGTAYVVTELLDGETLRGKLDGGPISQKQAVEYALQIVKGLSAAHEKGIVHRDLKPENVFVSKDGHVKILDFGLAKKVETAGPEEQTSAPTGAGHTDAGTVMGTMGYMSPEQLRGLPVDHRSDIFSFGAILYELLSGRKAFKRDTASDTIAAVLKEEPPELTQTGRNVSPALDHIVRHCLEKDRNNRFQSAKDVAFALSEASSSTTTVTSGVHALPRQPSRKKAGIVARAGRRSRGRGTLPLEAPEARTRSVRRRQARRRSAVREPGLARGRLLRRRDRRCDSRQADVPPRPRGHRARQLDALQEDDEDAAGDREGAGCPVPVDGDRALAEGRRRQPRPGQPGARRDPRVGSARLEVAAAVRRGDHGCLPGPVGHRDEGGAGAGRRARGRRGEAAFGRSPRRTWPPTTPS